MSCSPFWEVQVFLTWGPCSLWQSPCSMCAYVQGINSPLSALDSSFSLSHKHTSTYIHAHTRVFSLFLPFSQLPHSNHFFPTPLTLPRIFLPTPPPISLISFFGFQVLSILLFHPCLMRTPNPPCTGPRPEGQAFEKGRLSQGKKEIYCKMCLSRTL